MSSAVVPTSTFVCAVRSTFVPAGTLFALGVRLIDQAMGVLVTVGVGVDGMRVGVNVGVLVGGGSIVNAELLEPPLQQFTPSPGTWTATLQV